MKGMIGNRGDHRKDVQGLFLEPPDYIDNVVLAQDVVEQYDIPSGAKYVVLSGNLDFYARPIDQAVGGSQDFTTNGGFDSDSGWTKGTGWTIANGVASSSGAQAGDADLEQDANIVEGMSYLTKFTVSGRTAGNVTMTLGAQEGTDRATNATFEEVIVAGAGGEIKIRADLNFDGSIDDVSVVPAAVKATADIADGTGSFLNPAQWHVADLDTISFVAPAATIVTIAVYND